MTSPCIANDEARQELRYDSQRASESWEYLMGFTSPRAVTDITCTGASRVSQLPSDIDMFTELTRMDIYENCVEPLPSELSRLTNLKQLIIDETSMYGEIPDLSDLDLEMLQLSNNKFSGSIPESISENTRLTYLDLRGNNFDGSVPKSLGKLTSLRTLYLGGNSVSLDEYPEALEKLTDLQFSDVPGLGKSERSGSPDYEEGGAEISSIHVNYMVYAGVALLFTMGTVMYAVFVARPRRRRMMRDLQTYGPGEIQQTRVVVQMPPDTGGLPGSFVAPVAQYQQQYAIAEPVCAEQVQVIDAQSKVVRTQQQPLQMYFT